MSERGVFAIDRGAWEHDFLADDQPFSRREAWFWLVSEAAWKPHKRRILGRQIELSRGQYCGSFRFIASKWRWSEARVRRFVNGLISEQMVVAKNDAGVTVITICNYDRYQRVSLPDDAMRESDVDAVATHERRKVEDREYKEEDSEAKASGAEAPLPVYTDSRHELWGEGIPILISLGVADKQARSMIGSWLKSTRDDAQAVLGAIQRARDHRAHNPIPWITNALKGPMNGERPGTVHTDTSAGRATSRESHQVAIVGAAALRYLKESHAARQSGDLPRSPGTPEGFDFEPGAKIAR